jgi:hypothetical protein
MTALNSSAGQPTIAQTTVQMVAIPRWMAVSLARSLRAVSPGGGIGSALPMQCQTPCLFALQTTSYFR